MANIICSESKKRNMMRRDAEAPTGKNMAWHVSMVWTAATSTQLTSYHVHTHTLYSLSLSLSHTHVYTLSLSLSHTHTLHVCIHTHNSNSLTHTHSSPHPHSLSLSLSTHTHTHTAGSLCEKRQRQTCRNAARQTERQVTWYLLSSHWSSQPCTYYQWQAGRQAGRETVRQTLSNSRNTFRRSQHLSDRRSPMYAIHSVIHNTCQTDALQFTQYILSFTTLVHTRVIFSIVVWFVFILLLLLFAFPLKIQGPASKTKPIIYSALSLSLSPSLSNHHYSVLLSLLLLSFVVPLGCVVIVSRTGCPKGICA